VLDDIGEPVILVGHSYGGAVTEAGDHPMVDRLVYIAAFVLDAGESCMSTAIGACMGRPNLAEGSVTGPDETITLDPMIAAACLYNDCDDTTVGWAALRLGPHPLANLQQEPMAVAWRTRPSTYVVYADDLVVHPELQRAQARRCTSTVEWPTGHLPFPSRPALVVNLLGERATANE
jgi:pimeloyl-ACP methyl ester carboxylesterase